MKRVGPLFKWFGSKWQAARNLPPPAGGLVVEPFAGGAGYALNYAAGARAVLCETDPHLRRLWFWLIHEATESDIRDIPVGVPEGADIRSLGLSCGQATLLKSWQRTNNVGDCWTVSPWGHLPGQWTENTRARVAEEVQAVKGWALAPDGIAMMRYSLGIDATWFIDPPYQYNYQYRQKPLDYLNLSATILALRGEVIVCEAICPKTGAVPTWLPFQEHHKTVTSRRKASQSHHSREMLYHRGPIFKF